MTAPASAAPPLTRKLNRQLSLMMFLQYGIWGAWLPLFFPFLTVHRGFTPEQAGTLFAIGALGAVLAPFVSGQIADRYFNTEKFLGISHILGAILVWQLATVTTYTGFVIFGLLYSLIYAPTLSLTNSLAFHHIPDINRDFGRVRVWGTIGWVVVGIGIAQYLRIAHSPAELAGEDLFAAQVAGMGVAFKASAILGVILGLFCFFLPKTPPQAGVQNFAPFKALGHVVHGKVLLVLFLISFPIAIVHQFYFVRTAGFLGTLQSEATAGIDSFFELVFGVGGGGLMTIGQIFEIAVLACMPFLAKRIPRKRLLTLGLVAYTVRFAIFAYLPYTWAVVPALALHGICFGCFFFVAFMIVDEETTPDVRASAQGLYNLVIIAFGTIVGNLFAGQVDRFASNPEGGTDFQTLFAVPMGISAAALAALALFYPGKSRTGP
jgi:nucleoside transporter